MLCLKQDSVNCRSPEDHKPYFYSVLYLAGMTVQRTSDFLASEIVYFVVLVPFISGVHIHLQSGSTSVQNVAIGAPALMPCTRFVCRACPGKQPWEPPGDEARSHLE